MVKLRLIAALVVLPFAALPVQAHAQTVHGTTTPLQPQGQPVTEQIQLVPMSQAVQAKIQSLREQVASHMAPSATTLAVSNVKTLGYESHQCVASLKGSPAHAVKVYTTCGGVAESFELNTQTVFGQPKSATTAITAASW